MECRRNARCNTIECRRNAACTGNYKQKENTTFLDMAFQETTHKIIGIAMNSKESSAIMMQARMTYKNATMEI